MIFPDAIQHFDEKFFVLINRDGANHFFDVIMPPVRDKYFWVPVYGLIAVLLVIKFRIKAAFMIALLLINFGLTDQLSSAVLKPGFGRERPCKNEDLKDSMTLRLESCGAGKSFPSAHAANTFGFATLLFLLFRKKYKWVGPIAYLWALLISYAQVYVGVHYPLDIICGWITGLIIALFVYFISSRMISDRIQVE